jgi:Uma2 family endonuclease
MSSKSTTNGLRRSLRALPIVLGASALVVLGGAAAFDYPDSAVGARETASAATAPTAETPTPPQTLVVEVAKPTVTARPCPKRATFPCLG